MTERPHTDSVTAACPTCGEPIVTSHLPSGRFVIVDAQPIQAVFIVDVATKREPMAGNAWPVHRCKTAGKAG